MARFDLEAPAVSLLNHPNILTIYEVGEAEGIHFIEYVDGETLRRRFGKGRLELKHLLEIAIQALAALRAAYEAGMMHRDVKPENIMLRRDGYVTVVNFGLAKRSGPSGRGSEASTKTLRTDRAG